MRVAILGGGGFRVPLIARQLAELRTGERAGDRDEADLAAGGYESVAIALASALCGGPAAQLILNVRNGNTVPAMTPDTVIEVAWRVDGSGALPLPVSAPSAHELGLMSAVRACERDIADAALIMAAGRPGLARRGPGAARVRVSSPSRLGGCREGSGSSHAFCRIPSYPVILSI